MNFTDGTSLVTQAIIHIKITPPTSVARWSSANASNPNDFKFNGINGVLDYRIFYANNDGVYNRGYDLSLLQKPIIIVDGFDPLDKRKIEDSDPHPNSTDEDHRSIVELMRFFDNTNTKIDIIKELNRKGYDVIIVNHPEYTINNVNIDGGADFIERNGLTHASFYQEINKQLTLNGNYNNQLVIMGPSMGGLITRYALAFMEKKEAETGLDIWNHNTKLWVSIDSPHLGANIPMGVQSLLYTLKNVAGSQAAVDYVNDELNSNAAKQLLIEQYKQKYINMFGINLPRSSGNLLTDYLDAKTVSQGFSEDRGRPEFISFYNNLYSNGLPNSNGYPQNLKKIAITNGSLTGSKTYKANDYTSDFSNNGAQTLKIKGFANGLWSGSTIHIVTMENYFMSSYGNNHKISYYKTKKLFGWNYTNTYISNINSRGTLDNVAGGFFGVNNLVASSITDQHPYEQVFGGDIGSVLIGGYLFGGAGLIVGAVSNWGISVNSWSVPTLKPVSSFIPTISSLGIKNPDFNWNQAIGNENLVCTDKTPFDSYYGETYNTEHISFSENSFNWLNDWLDADPINGPFPAPSVYLNSDDLIGDNSICQNEVNTYSFTPCKVSGNITWSVHPKLSIISSDNNSVTVKADQPFYTYWIKATLENGSFIKKEIFGTPRFTNTPMYGNSNLSPNYLASYSVQPAEGATNYHWSIDIGSQIGENVGGWQIYSGQGTTSVEFRVGSSNYSSVVIRCEAINGCGRTLKYKYVTVSSGGNNGSDPCDPINITYQVNKVSNQYNTYSVNPIDDPCDPNNIQNLSNVQLYSAYGIEEQGINYQNNEIELQNVQSGKIKIIKAVIGNKVVIKRIITD